MTEPPEESRFQSPFGDDYVTPGQAARYLGVSPRTISRWANEGRLACIVTLGRQRRFLRTEIEDAARRMLDGGSGRHR